MKGFRLIFFAFFFPVILFGQNKNREAENVYHKLNQLKDQIYDDEAKAVRTIDSLKPVLIKMKNDSLHGLYWRLNYNLHSNQLKNDEALKDIEKSISYYTNAQNWKGTVLSTMNKGNLSMKKADYKNAVRIYLGALDLAKRKNLTKQEGLLQKNIGVAFYNQNRFDEALYYDQKALQAFIKVNDQTEIAATYTNIGNAYYSKYENKKAEEYYLRALQINEKQKDSVTLAKLYNNLGAVYSDDSTKFKKAKQYVLKSLELKKILGIQDDLVFQYTNVANICANLGEFDEAKTYLDIAYKMATKAGNREELKEIHSVYSLIYYGKGDYKKAVESERTYAKYKDSILNEENSKIVEEINTKYKTAEKDREILQSKTKF